MSLVLVWYPAFVGAFYLGSCPKSCCKFDHQQFHYELCLPVEMRAGTSTMPGRKAFWLWLSGSCISFWIECVSVSRMRRTESCWRHQVGRRLPASKSHSMRMSVARHEPLSSEPAVARKTVHDPIKNVLAHLWWGCTQGGFYCHLTFPPVFFFFLFLGNKRWCHLVKGTKLWLLFALCSSFKYLY